MNTTARPPAEDYAYPVAEGQLRRFADRFAGRAEVICEHGPEAAVAAGAAAVDDADILGLLRRRPCTVQGVAAGLGLQMSDAAKRLRVLTAEGRGAAVRKMGALFYEAVRPRKPGQERRPGTI